MELKSIGGGLRGKGRGGGKEASGSSKKSYKLETIREGIKKGFRYVGESKDRVLYISMAVVDNIVS
jgi:hypothetical protein